MKYLSLLLLLSCIPLCLVGQSNVHPTNRITSNILNGNYNPADYAATTVINHPDALIRGIQSGISSDSLKAYIIRLSEFQNRNTGADTLSNITGIGAARRWVYRKFQKISQQRENRLIPSYLQFDLNICGMNQHRNVFAVLPGMDTTTNGIILIEAHMDSRCQTPCDTTCLAEGVEDNATGSALVIELARVMSQYSYNQTIVFMLTIGEEQGLYGAKAFAAWSSANRHPIKAVLNNDVVGGIICGASSSKPSCSGLNNIDSTQLRMFSSGGFNSRNKQLVRFIKLQYQEELLPIVAVPMTLTVMSSEDRSGRGGDHIPFRQKRYPAMRFTSANEHGDASNRSGYMDRQHTTNDILGVDTDGDEIIDSFFVDFHYLARNAVINGVAAAMAAVGPITPNFSATRAGDELTVEIEDANNYNTYRIALRTDNNDWDTVYTLTDSKIGLFKTGNQSKIIVSVASVDSNDIESLFSNERIIRTTGVSDLFNSKDKPSNFELFQNKPNPFDEATIISFFAHVIPDYKRAYIRIMDLQGKTVLIIDTPIKYGMNEILYRHAYNKTGTFIYSLVIDDEVIASKTMVFAN